MTVDEISELMRIASEKMAIKVSSATPTLFRVSAYGIFDGDAEDWGFESADCGICGYTEDINDVIEAAFDVDLED
jgi:hypothetical protein